MLDEQADTCKPSQHWEGGQPTHSQQCDVVRSRPTDAANCHMPIFQGLGLIDCSLCQSLGLRMEA